MENLQIWKRSGCNDPRSHREAGTDINNDDVDDSDRYDVHGSDDYGVDDGDDYGVDDGECHGIVPACQSTAG